MHTIFIDIADGTGSGKTTRKYADIIVLEGGRNLVALDLIMQRIANLIAEN